MDRNEKARQEFQAKQQALQAQRARQQFLADVASGVTGAYDFEHTRIEPGHLVIWQPPPQILYWEVIDVGPALDLPQAAMKVTIACTVPIIVGPGQRMTNLLVRGRKASEEAGAPGTSPPATSPPDNGHGDPPAPPPEEDSDGPQDD